MGMKPWIHETMILETIENGNDRINILPNFSYRVTKKGDDITLKFHIDSEELELPEKCTIAALGTDDLDVNGVGQHINLGYFLFHVLLEDAEKIGKFEYKGKSKNFRSRLHTSLRDYVA